jgi:hypothetical protein
MPDELNLLKVGKIVAKNKKSIFLFSLIFCITSYFYSYTIQEKYKTNLQFFKPEIINFNFEAKLFLDEYLVDSFKQQELKNPSKSLINFEQIFFQNLNMINNFENFLQKKKVKEILKKDSAQIISNILSEKFNIEEKFFLNKKKNIPIFELEVIHYKQIMKDLELLIPMYIKHLRKLTMIQYLQSEYSKLKINETIVTNNLNIAISLGLENSLYLHLGEKLNGTNFNATSKFLFYEGTIVLNQIMNNIKKEKIKIEEIISELTSDNANVDQNFLVRSISGKFVNQNLISPIRSIYAICGLLFGFIISLFFIFFRSK